MSLFHSLSSINKSAFQALKEKICEGKVKKKSVFPQPFFSSSTALLGTVLVLKIVPL
jgi:hypothetical protein